MNLNILWEVGYREKSVRELTVRMMKTISMVTYLSILSIFQISFLMSWFVCKSCFRFLRSSFSFFMLLVIWVVPVLPFLCLPGADSLRFRHAFRPAFVFVIAVQFQNFIQFFFSFAWLYLFCQRVHSSGSLSVAWAHSKLDWGFGVLIKRWRFHSVMEGWYSTRRTCRHVVVSACSVHLLSGILADECEWRVGKKLIWQRQLLSACDSLSVCCARWVLPAWWLHRVITLVEEHHLWHLSREKLRWLEGILVLRRLARIAVPARSAEVFISTHVDLKGDSSACDLILRRVVLIETWHSFSITAEWA